MDTDDISDVEEDEDTLLCRAFEIVEPHSLNETPVDGNEYLFHVKREALKSPRVVVAHVDRKRFEKNQTFYVDENDVPSTTAEFLPSLEWQHHQIKTFEKLRCSVEDLRGVRDISTVSQDKKSEAAWLDFIKKTPEPSLSEVLALSQATLDHLFQWFSVWLSDETLDFSYSVCLWIYCALAAVPTPILPETCSSIRRICSLAKSVRAGIRHKGDEKLVRLNLLICLVGRCFRQYDLADGNT